MNKNRTKEDTGSVIYKEQLNPICIMPVIKLLFFVYLAII